MAIARHCGDRAEFDKCKKCQTGAHTDYAGADECCCNDKHRCNNQEWKYNQPPKSAGVALYSATNIALDAVVITSFVILLVIY